MREKMVNLKVKNILVIAGLFICVAFMAWLFSSAAKRYAQSDYEDILVERVIDGDTLKLSSGERVRLIGIDTPEMHESEKLYRDARRSSQYVQTIKRLGRQAYEFTRNLLEGRRVRFEFDVQKRDRYGRLLAYVYLKDDGTFV
ncbi:MAG: thermonuclease family protein, partial [Candidatus Omnitrophica bacterium]|nr:thermonuclease family protein [Candidatus Omnitrophota bacterium]